MRRSLLGLLILLAPPARAGDTWVAPHAIPLEQLAPDEQARAIDAARKDAREAAGVRAHVAASSRLAVHAEYQRAAAIAGVDLLAAGVRP